MRIERAVTGQASRRVLERTLRGMIAACIVALAPWSPNVVRAQQAPATYLIVVTGVSGQKEYAAQYDQWAAAIAAAARDRFGIADSLVTILGEDTMRVAGRPRLRATRDNVLAAVQSASKRARPGDRIAILLFGHGNAQDDTPRINLPGPDATADDFARALQPAAGVTVAFVNTASASGGFVKAISGANRIVVTATRSSREQNETTFPRHFVRALTSADADADKDGRASLLEAFTYARKEVARAFEQGNRIATEHPLLDDDGDGEGNAEPGAQGGDGGRARAFFLEPMGGVQNALSADPRAATLLAERRVLEGKIDSLRARRASMSEEAYQKALEPLMLELAEKSRALRALEGKKP